jgi:hypothetical protein
VGNLHRIHLHAETKFRHGYFDDVRKVPLVSLDGLFAFAHREETLWRWGYSQPLPWPHSAPYLIMS